MPLPFDPTDPVMTRDEARRQADRVQATFERMMLDCAARTGLSVTLGHSAAGLLWVSWDGRRDAGYWVDVGTVVSGTDEHPNGSGFATVQWLEDTEDDSVSRDVLDVRDIPAVAVGDGTPLAQMVINALLTEPGADPLTNARKD